MLALCRTAQPTACDAGVSGNCVLRAVEAEARCLPTVVRRQGGSEVCHGGEGWCVPVGGGCQTYFYQPLSHTHTHHTLKPEEHMHGRPKSLPPWAMVGWARGAA